MGWISITCIILTMIVAVALIIVVVLQESKTSQSSITGNNTFYGSNKGKTQDALLSKITVFLAFCFIILSFATTIVIMK